MATYNPPAQTGDAEASLRRFWKLFHDNDAGTHVKSILEVGGKSQDPHVVEGKLIEGATAGSYDEAKAACVGRVHAIVRECQRNNEQFTDPDFDLKNDFYNHTHSRECLRGLPIPVTENKAAQNDDWGAASRDARGSADADALKKQCSKSSPSTRKLMARRYQMDDWNQPKSVQRASKVFEHPIFAPGSHKSHLPLIEHQHVTTWTKLFDLLPRLRCGLSVVIALVAVLLVLVSSAYPVVYRPAFTTAVIGFILALCIWAFSTRHPTGPLYTSSEIQQSDYLGNCWFLAGVASLGSRNDFLQKVCVAWDQRCGVFGFVFHRDGEWTYTVVDDYLYLTKADFQASVELLKKDDHRRSKSYRKFHQSGSTALHFARCRDENQIWLPLLEKAYAKLHGDYSALHRGWTEEAIEDLSGGVANTFRTDSILDQDQLWREMRSKKNYVYSFSSPPNTEGHGMNGLASSHAYAVETALTYFDMSSRRSFRLLRIRNPWGRRDGLWQGPFSTGSKEWTPFACWWLGKSAEEGVFYMTLEDALNTFRRLSRAQMFDQTWSLRQSWTKLIVDWVPQYNQVYFLLTLTRASEVVLSLSQLNTRHFRGLEGRYVFHLEFLIRSRNATPGDYIARVTAADDTPQEPRRSASLEKELEEGTYEILIKITAFCSSENEVWSVEDMVRQSTHHSKKLQQIARNYDTAHKKLSNINPPSETQKKKHIAAWEGTGSAKEDSASEAINMTSDPALVAWNAVCGVGLRVFSKDEQMELDLLHRAYDEPLDDVSEANLGAQNEAEPWPEEHRNDVQDAAGWETSSWDRAKGESYDKATAKHESQDIDQHGQNVAGGEEEEPELTDIDPALQP
ncbi:Calpain-5 [Pseudocercospora fuligena]|uniref:Calpain-5 n=1 Tax=Pseudocercospora fuligena TaxID=685502 RepID=A0A8H6RED4_9PEZI|nr:Calpain-5 [Pseudocercospora fuligena]